MWLIPSLPFALHIPSRESDGIFMDAPRYSQLLLDTHQPYPYHNRARLSFDRTRNVSHQIISRLLCFSRMLHPVTNLRPMRYVIRHDARLKTCVRLSMLRSTSLCTGVRQFLRLCATPSVSCAFFFLLFVPAYFKKPFPYYSRREDLA